MHVHQPHTQLPQNHQILHPINFLSLSKKMAERNGAQLHLDERDPFIEELLRDSGVRGGDGTHTPHCSGQ